MKKIKIKGVHKPIYNCLECNKPLTQNEYNECKVFCTSCKFKHYDRLFNGYNDVDGILLEKRERR